MQDDHRARLIGVNHVALEVGDVDAAVEFYGRVFRFELRGEHRDDSGRRVMAFLDMGDQFLALNEVAEAHRDGHRHFGLVVDDRAHVLELAEAAGGQPVEGSKNNFRDPWGNRIEVVEYRSVQFTKVPPVLDALGVDGTKTDDAQRQLRDKGMVQG
jgi:catechol 2,3-dioxygenase-like lactoylglutathione lyase family enzyme